MRKIELNIEDVVTFSIDGTKYELKLTKTAVEATEIKPEPKRLLTVEEIMNEESENPGFFITDHTIAPDGLSPYGQHFRDTATKAQAQKLIALAEIMRLADYYNEHYADGWKPDSISSKWFVIKMSSGLHVVTYYCTNMFGLPAFASEGLAQLALDNNREVFERFFNA